MSQNRWLNLLARIRLDRDSLFDSSDWSGLWPLGLCNVSWREENYAITAKKREPKSPLLSRFVVRTGA